MKEGCRILLVHSDPGWMRDVRNALGRELEAIGASSADEAWPHLQSYAVDLVVAEENVGVAFLEELARRSPGTRRAILLNGGDRRPWVEAAAEGHQFIGIPEHAPDLAARLRALVPPRPAAQRDLCGCTMEVTSGTGRTAISGPVLRLTSDSASFRVEPGDALEEFLPGREIAEIVVRRGCDVLLDGCTAIVQDLMPDPTGGYELDMTLCTPTLPPARRHVVRDLLQRASLIAEALRRGRLTMERADGAPAHAVVRGRVDALAELLLIEGPPDGFATGAAVRFAFEAGGAHFQFFGALADSPVATEFPAVAVALPDELRGRCRRRARVPLAAGEAAVSLLPLLVRDPVRRALIDVEMEGMGFLADPGDLLPVGTRLRDMRIALPERITLRASGRITSRSSSRTPAGTRAVRCGVQFDPLAPEEQSILAGAILRRMHTDLELARGLTFDALWGFLRDCGFLYPEKEEKLRAVFPDIGRTMSSLLANPDGPLRTLLFRASGALQGHISAVRVYRRTWMVQHLAARRDGPGRLVAAKALSSGVVDYLEQLPDFEWVRIWFRPNNRWPARTFGRFARLQFDPRQCDLRTYAYLTADARGESASPASFPNVAPATACDWAEIRRHLVAARQTASLAAEDLCSASDLYEVGELYRGIGLIRRREALVARRGDRLAGFALLEVSSPGLNLSELTNAFRVFVVDDDPSTTTALAARARERYAELGRPLAIGLAESPDLDAWAAAGFTKSKEYSCWTAHRSLVRRYVEFMQRLYEYAPPRPARPHT